MHVTVTGGTGPSQGVAAGGRIQFDLPASEGGGAGFNGGEALLLAVAGCYANDLRRLIRARGLPIEGFRIDVDSTWGGTPVACRSMDVTLELTGDIAPVDEADLRRDLDANAAIPWTLREGVSVTLRPESQP